MFHGNRHGHKHYKPHKFGKGFDRELPFGKRLFDHWAGAKTVSYFVNMTPWGKSSHFRDHGHDVKEHHHHSNKDSHHKHGSYGKRNFGRDDHHSSKDGKANGHRAAHEHLDAFFAKHFECDI